VELEPLAFWAGTGKVRAEFISALFTLLATRKPPMNPVNKAITATRTVFFSIAFDGIRISQAIESVGATKAGQASQPRPREGDITNSFLLPFSGDVRQVLCPSADRRVSRSPTRDGVAAASVDTASWQTLAVDGLHEDAGYLLRQGAVLQCGAAPQRFLEFVGHICTNENTFTVCHKNEPSFSFVEKERL
jgi:hypothetical protein